MGEEVNDTYFLTNDETNLSKLLSKDTGGR